MNTNWVDFKAVKEAVSMRMVLDHYQVNWLRKSGKEFRGRCPIHRGEGADTFHASIEKNAFHCFSCKAKGNVLDFVAAMEKCSVRDAGLKLTKWFSVGGAAFANSKNSDDAIEEEKPAIEESRGEQQPENAPLKFQLKGIEVSHPYLVERGITKETAETFGVGFFPGKGSMNGRIVIPIHNERGELLAYAGRSVDGSEPKYKLPAGFHKSQVLFNFHRAAADEDCLVILVEGFFDTLMLHQAGFPATVALMGCQLSPAQEQLLVSQFEEAIVLLDGDEAGRTASREIAARLVTQMFVRVVDLEDGQQPDSMQPESLHRLLSQIL